MQRTVTTTTFTFADTRLVKTPEGMKVEGDIKNVTVIEADAKKAYKKAVKTVGHAFKTLETKTETALYEMDDDVFIRMATKKAKDIKES